MELASGRIAARAAICTMVGVLAMVGCGGSGTGSSTTGLATTSVPPLIKHDFVSQANGACKEADREVRSLKKPSSNSDFSILATFAGQQLDIVNQAYAKLVALTPPADQQRKYGEFLNYLHFELGAVGQLKSAAEAGDSKKVKSIESLIQQSRAKADADARALGLSECATPQHR